MNIKEKVKKKKLFELIKDSIMIIIQYDSMLDSLIKIFHWYKDHLQYLNYIGHQNKINLPRWKLNEY